MEASGKQSFMEEVSILTISTFFIIIYLYSILCIYFYILLYDFLQFLCLYRKPSTSIDASVYVSITNAMVETIYSFGVTHTPVCVTFYKFTIVISLFSNILKFIMFSCFYTLQDQVVSSNVHLNTYFIKFGNIQWI
jgi:hypothetical protein